MQIIFQYHTQAPTVMMATLWGNENNRGVMTIYLHLGLLDGTIFNGVKGPKGCH
ncbi:MAG: hypothetical protein IPL23_07940 [Saprospiraceae bacterium]|nr:hypothetical protein [Saprospiraceae bacterium]